MPVVSFPVDRFNQLLGGEYDKQELVDTLEKLGCDVEDTAELLVCACPRCAAPTDKLAHEGPPKRCEICGHESEEPFPEQSRQAVIRLELLAARPDLLDVGGLTRALKGYLGIETGLPCFEIVPGDVTVQTEPALAEESSYRPYIVCAVVRVPPLQPSTLREIMRLQENLHWGIGRDRKLTSIGVYDLDTVRPPFHYRTVGPEELTFVPLGCAGQPMTPRQILEEHPKGVAYAHLLAAHARYPLLVDVEGQVLSMPPIINSEETRLRLGTRNLFIDVTGVARDPVINTLNTLISSLIEIGGRAESVTVSWADGSRHVTPDLTPRRIEVSRSAAEQWIGASFSDEEFRSILARMRYDVTGDGERYTATFPAFRTDIRHEVDVFEDLAIGYGYDRIVPRLVETMTVGTPRPEEVTAGLLREIMIGLGYTEILGMVLYSEEDLLGRLRLEAGPEVVRVANAKTRDQAVVRSHLMTALLSTLGNNWRRTPPVQLFEIGNVVLCDEEGETGTREEKRLAFAVMGPEAGYADVRAVLDAVLREMDRPGEYAPRTHPSFIPGRCAGVTAADGWQAVLGEIHPEVLNAFGIPHPVALAELTFARVI
jgi:phenylalanyl-tRNA synthetase beta chain